MQTSVSATMRVSAREFGTSGFCEGETPRAMLAGRCDRLLKDYGRIVTSATLEAPTEDQIQIVVASATDVGGRTGNEDAVAVEPLLPVGEGEAALEGGYLAILADGMGGYQRGEVASEMAIEIVKEMFAADPGADSALLLKQAFRRANDRIYANGQGAVPPQMMGTTLVVAAVRGKYATIANIGDSRAYLARAGRLTQVTKDHSLVADQVAAGSMTEDEARESPHRNILTHALGHRAKLDAKMPNIFELTLLPEDQLLLCTDGFYDVVPSADLLNVLLTSGAKEATGRLIDLAKERGTSDNVSAVIISVQSTREPLAVLAGSDPVPTGQSRLPIIILGAIAALIAIALLAFLFVL
jgi:PPM family protein phosphatase